MPKLIIPNAFELHYGDTKPIDSSNAVARLFYNFRFLWFLERGDIILLPEYPSKHWLSYLTGIKRLTLNSIKIIVLGNKTNITLVEALANPLLIEQLQIAMSNHSQWFLQTCFWNSTILNLARKLPIHLSQTQVSLVEKDFYQKSNSKSVFRILANKNKIPIPMGKIGSCLEDCKQAITSLLKITDQVIVKQDYNAGGRGNIGIASHTNAVFTGTTQTIFINQTQSIEEITEQLWKIGRAHV